MLDRMSNIFQRVLWESRMMILFPVIAGVLSALIMILIGTLDVISSLYELPTLLFAPHREESGAIIMHIIRSLDAFLIATVLLIFSIGLYELFISKISYAERDERSSQILVIHSLDQLKEKVAKVIIMVLIVTFFQESMNFAYKSVLDLLYLALAIFLISLAVYFTHKHGRAHSLAELKKSEEDE